VLSSSSNFLVPEKLLPEQAAADALFDPLELYAAAIDASDYVAALAPLIRQTASEIGDLLDVGAGGGQLGAALAAPHARFTAIEPSSTMRARLLRLPNPPAVLACGWEEAAIADASHDTVLAATMPAVMEQAAEFLPRCRRWARRQVVWVVPAHHGPRGLCFAGCLPSAWHGEDETPGLDTTLRNLRPADRPHAMQFVDWTFTGVVADVSKLASFLAGRLGWPPHDARRAQLHAHLVAQMKPRAKPRDGAVCLEIPRRSAVLVWRK
jgi:SAM-dependent methyltransferase